jgi:Peptidase family M28
VTSARERDSLPFAAGKLAGKVPQPVREADSPQHLGRGGTCVASFRRHAEFPSEGVAAPAFIPGVDWSDHWSFWKEGYPALMVTDTAPYRYPYYHTAQDTPDKVDYARVARVVTGLQRMLCELASGADAPRR